MDENYFSIMADDYDFRTLGIIEVGTFNSDGFPKDFEVANEISDYQLPRFLEKEPVLYVPHGDNTSVYVRGLYSKKLSYMRAKAQFK